MCPHRVERRRGKDRRKGGDRRSGVERRKAIDPQNHGVEGRTEERYAADPKCQRCVATFGEVRVLILECPTPHRNCNYKQYHELIHYVTYPSARAENYSAVVASSSHPIVSTNVILISPDPMLTDHQIYYVDLTDGRTT